MRQQVSGAGAVVIGNMQHRSRRRRRNTAARSSAQPRVMLCTGLGSSAGAMLWKLTAVAQTERDRTTAESQQAQQQTGAVVALQVDRQS